MTQSGVCTHDRCLQELGTHSGVFTDGKGNLVNVGSGSLTDGREGVDGRDSLGQHGVGSELGKLGRPKTDSQDSVLGDPVGVDVGQGGTSVKTGLVLEGTDQDSVGVEQVGDGGTFSQEFWVGQNVESASWSRVGLENGSHSAGRQHGLPAGSRGKAGAYSAVRHGTVDFSTTILDEVETSAIRRVASWR